MACMLSFRTAVRRLLLPQHTPAQSPAACMLSCSCVTRLLLLLLPSQLVRSEDWAQAAAAVADACSLQLVLWHTNSSKHNTNSQHQGTIPVAHPIVPGPFEHVSHHLQQQYVVTLFQVPTQHVHNNNQLLQTIMSQHTVLPRTRTEARALA